MEIGVSFIEEPDGHNRCRNTFGGCVCRFKTDEEISCLRVFFNLVSCSFSKNLEFEPPARSHWRMVNLSFLGLKWLCLARWQASAMAPAFSFPLHSEVRHTVKATYCPPENAKYLKRLRYGFAVWRLPPYFNLVPKVKREPFAEAEVHHQPLVEPTHWLSAQFKTQGFFLCLLHILQQRLWHGLKSVWRFSC